MKRLIFLGIVALLAVPALAQQTGSVLGVVTTDTGTPIPGVTVTATSSVLPQERTTVTDADGRYRFPLLPPGDYELTFDTEGLATQTLALTVFLDSEIPVNVEMTVDALSEVIEVTASTEMIDLTSTELKASVDYETIQAIPLGQEYRDLIKLAPGVQYTEDTVRGPSAGGNGQDNVYLYDGVDVGLPLFGTLSAEPAAFDIEQVSFVRGGAKAQDFNRSGGFLVNSVTRSGTNAYHGLVNYQLQSASMTGDRDVPSTTEDFDEDKDWANLAIGGPILSDRLFFYASYYRPTVGRDNRDNVYGAVPNFDSTRNEYFGKLTWTPSSSLLFNASYRDSETDQKGSGVCGTCAATTSSGNDSGQNILVLDGSWLINNRSNLFARYNDFENPSINTPDNILNINVGPGVNLDIANLEGQGRFNVPQPIAGNPDFNAWAAPLIQQYGYNDNGVQTGGGAVGVDSTFDDITFDREELRLGYDFYLTNHELHFGGQYYDISENLLRTSNGWGNINPIGGRDPDFPQVYYEARIWQQTLSDTVPSIKSSSESYNLEINDTITFRDFTFNVGFVFSQDTYYGSGLRATGQGVSGFEVSPGTKYKMYEIDFDEMIQPRLGVNWSPNGEDVVYASYARYNPAASSLPRAASWDRNLQREIDVQFDQNGNYLGIDPLASSSGKWFQAGIDPRQIDEYILGYENRISNRLVGRAHYRQREGKNFWEDTNNNARSRFNPPPGIPTGDYVPNLDEIRDEIGGSSYVIAELDGAFTDYYELSAEAEYRGSKWYARGTYVWSQYYGNFDQDNSTDGNDGNIFIGSSFIADGAGRQLWDNKYGYLRGDRRNQVKIYGFYQLPWDATTGGFFIYQDGQPWEAWNVEVYRDLTGSSSDTNRYAEPAGNRRTDEHWQLDLNYTQNFRIGERFNVQLRGDVFNVFDEQTGYNIQNKVNEANFGVPRTYFNPRRLQLAVRFEF